MLVAMATALHSSIRPLGIVKWTRTHKHVISDKNKKLLVNRSLQAFNKEWIVTFLGIFL